MNRSNSIALGLSALVLGTLGAVAFVHRRSVAKAGDLVLVHASMVYASSTSDPLPLDPNLLLFVDITSTSGDPTNLTYQGLIVGVSTDGSDQITPLPMVNTRVNFSRSAIVKVVKSS